MSATDLGDPALTAYERMAPYYDLFTASYDYDRWLSKLEALALEHGLEGKRLLDVGCGTGKSFAPMLARGYEVVACDISPSMVELAREQFGERAEIFVADMRELPRIDSFDLVTCLDDALNYVLSDDELAGSLEGIARNLRPGGLLIFDLNTVTTYRWMFAGDFASESDGVFLCWHGQASEDAEPGEIHSAVLEVFATEDGECWRRHSCRHVQRHHTREAVDAALERAGLELVLVHGQVTGAQIDALPDEGRHRKLIHLARKPLDAGR
jgi:SAM-dependent methyltransferase